MRPRRTEIKKIDDPKARNVTFSKRRKGLFKKAAELSRLCNVDVAAVVFSPAGNIFEFSSTNNTPVLLDSFLAAHSHSHSHSDCRRNSQQSLLSDIESKLSVDISNLPIAELQQYRSVLNEIKGDLLRCLEARSNPSVIAPNNLSASVPKITAIDGGENQDEAFELTTPEEFMSMNYEVYSGENQSSAGFGLSPEEVMSMNDEIQNDESQGIVGFGLNLGEIMWGNDQVDGSVWMMPEDQHFSDHQDLELMWDELMAPNLPTSLWDI